MSKTLINHRKNLVLFWACGQNEANVEDQIPNSEQVMYKSV